MHSRNPVAAALQHLQQNMTMATTAWLGMCSSSSPQLQLGKLTPGSSCLSSSTNSSVSAAHFFSQPGTSALHSTSGRPSAEPRRPARASRSSSAALSGSKQQRSSSTWRSRKVWCDSITCGCGANMCQGIEVRARQVLSSAREQATGRSEV
jgi:hypothetical protein